MKALLAILGTYAVTGLLGFAFYVLSFRLPLGGEILFYRGVVLACLVALGLAALMTFVRRRFGLELATIVGAVLTSFALNTCFLVLFPVTVDRSISVFLLSRIEAQQPLTAAQLQQAFAGEYLGRMEQIPRRVREQRISGNIAVSRDGTITLTPQGRRFNALARAASGWFGTDTRFVDARTSAAHANPPH